MTVAVHYTSARPPDSRDRTVFGLQVAIAGWLGAWLRYGSAGPFPFLIAEESEQEEVCAVAARYGIEAARLRFLDRRFPEQNFAGLTSVFRAEPDTRRVLWQRHATGAGFAFCGLAHAIAGVEAGTALEEYCLGPAQAGDAIICPSRAVAGAIRAFWDHYGDYLAAKFGADAPCPVQLPVIPLGIDCDAIAARVTADKRTAQRAALSIGADEIVVLWVGRLSAAIKAHPLAMFDAAERAAQMCGRRLRLVMVGYFVPETAEADFRTLAAAVCATVAVDFVAAGDSRFPDGLWAAGDIFLSLVDNGQESFGLTPVEAMAAGLPRVVSDWNGYRDCVADGEDGFLVPVRQVPPGQGGDLVADVLHGREIYGGFLAKAALSTAVDAGVAAQRIATLAGNPDLRAAMAGRARARARAEYDWRAVMPRYEVLWAEQAAQRAAAMPVPLAWGGMLPQLPDPTTMYAGYPSAALADSDRVRLVGRAADRIRAVWPQAINRYADGVLLSPADKVTLLGWLDGRGGVLIGDVLAAFPDWDRARLWRTLGWLLKLGIVEIG